MEERWFAPHVAYTMAKFGMSMVVLGVAGEYRGRVGINALWPRTMIDTAAMAEFKPHLDIGPLRSPEILADAAHIILTSEAQIDFPHRTPAAPGSAFFAREVRVRRF